MISTSFIHACDDAYMIESTYENNARTINELAGTLDVLSQQRRDLKMFGLFTESKEEYFGESVGDAIEKLGQKIIEIIERFKDAMKDIFRKWKERSWQKKDDVQKLREIEKKDPKAAAKLEAAIAKGDIDMNSYKDINAFFKDVDNILADIEKKNVDPKSLKGRLNRAKDALNDKKGTIAAIGTALGLVATATGLVITYQKYKEGCAKKISTEGENIRNEADVRMKKLRVEVTKLREMEQNGDPHAGSKAAILADLANEVDHVTRVNVSKRMTLMRSIEAKIAIGARKVYGSIFKGSVAKQNEKAGFNKFSDDHHIYAAEIKKRQEEFNRLNSVVRSSPSGEHKAKEIQYIPNEKKPNSKK